MDRARARELAALVETITVLVLFVNLFTVHEPAVSSLAGPVHGTAYLVVIALAFAGSDLGRGARWLSVVPVIGGWLVVRAARTRAHDAGRKPRVGP
jgi:hypothetical protein